MIADLLSVAGPDGRAPLRRNLRGLVAESVLTGVGFALMVPLLRALFDGRIAAAWGWIAAMAALLVVYAAVRYRTQLAGYLAAIAIARSLFDRLGEQIARLPLGWFGAERVGQVGRLASQGVIDVIGVPAHLLRPLVTALATPATVLALMFFFDWRLAAAALVTAPAAYLLYRWTGALTEAADHRVHAAATEAAGRLVEFAQTQPVLRAFGEGARGLGRLDAALTAQHAASRAQMTSVARALLSLAAVVQVAFTILLVFGVNLGLGGRIEAAELVALLVLCVRYAEPLLGAAELEGSLRIARNGVARMNALLETPPLPEPDAPQTPAPPRSSSTTCDSAMAARPC